MSALRRNGAYMTRVFNGERTFLSPILRPVEGALYRLAGVEERSEQSWLGSKGC
jgi:potassium-transporting ATPase potassium-binding subunit